MSVFLVFSLSPLVSQKLAPCLLAQNASKNCTFFEKVLTLSKTLHFSKIHIDDQLKISYRSNPPKPLWYNDLPKFNIGKRHTHTLYAPTYNFQNEGRQVVLALALNLT